jgi:putative DNA primase/helicase
MTDNMDDIRKRVKARVDREAKEYSKESDEGGDKKVSIKFIHECLFANELGDGILYATLFRDRFLYCKNTQEWFNWSGHHWQRDIMGRCLAAVEEVVKCYLGEYRRIAGQITDITKGTGTGDVEKLKKQQAQLLKRASQLRGDKRRTASLKFSHTNDNPLAISGSEFDAMPWLLACKNGVIDLRTGNLKDGRPSDYLSMASPTDFKGLDEPANLWEKTLLEIFHGDEELVLYLQRLFGYGITGLSTEKVFLVLWGKGKNGKSLIVETISHVLGPLVGSIQSEMLLNQYKSRSSAGPSPDIMGLKGLRMAFASEVDQGSKLSSSRVKWLTGNDELVGRNPHDKYETRFKPTQKLFLLTNSQPHASANDFALWERMHLIPFTLSFVNREPQSLDERWAIKDLDEQLKKEAPQILAWLVKGCLAWEEQGLNPPRKVTEATEQYRRNEDLLADFVDECCEIEPGAQTKASELYSRFTEWYLENVGKKIPSNAWFGKSISLKFEKNKINGCIHYHGVALCIN